MKIVYHPDFPKQIRRFQGQYGKISERLSLRFRSDIDEAIERIKAAPTSAGHFVQTDSRIVKEVRRRNLSSFPFFILYAIHEELLIFRSVIPAASDPMTWPV